MKTIFSLWIENIIEALYPARCMACERVLPYQSEKLHYGQLHTSVGLCPRCQGVFPAFFQGLDVADGAFLPENRCLTVYSLFDYNGLVRQRILDMKFKHKPAYAKGFLAVAGPHIPWGHLETGEMLVPVPLHRKRHRNRGFNQAEWIADGLSVVLGIPEDKTLVYRRKNTEPQRYLSREQRKENMKDVFALSKGRSVAGKKIILVDDILTTGSTLMSLAGILYEKGAAEVWGFVLARA